MQEFKDVFQHIKGEVEIVVIREDGKVENIGSVPNLFLSAGMYHLAVLQTTAPGSVMNHMHVGTGPNGAASMGIIDLEGRVGSRSTMLSRTTPASTNILVEVATFAGFISGITSLVLREIGRFNHATSGGIMAARATFSNLTLADSDFAQFSWRTTVGSTA